MEWFRRTDVPSRMEWFRRTDVPPPPPDDEPDRAEDAGPPPPPVVSVAGGFFGTAKVPHCCCCRCTAGTLDDRADLVELEDLAEYLSVSSSPPPTPRIPSCVVPTERTAVGIMSPEARTSSNLAISCDNLAGGTWYFL